VNPKQEIDAKARDSFWAKEEEEEKKRQLEELKRKEEERKRNEEELKKREVYSFSFNRKRYKLTGDYFITTD